MKDREIIYGVLHGIGRRLWWGRMGREALFGLCVLLYFLVAMRMAGALQPAGIPTSGIPAWVAAMAGIAAFVAYLAWRIARKVTPEQAAAHADSSAALHDELKSAWWFVSQGEQSPFIEAQVSRAAATASRLDPRRLVPARPPRTLYAAIALGGLLAGVTWLAPQLTPYWDANAAPSPSLAQEQDLRALLRDAPQDARIDKLDEALQTLESETATREQKREAMEAVRDLSAQAQMDAMAARDGLARFAETIATNPELAEVAEALKAGDPGKALERIEAFGPGPKQEKDAEPFKDAGNGGQSLGSTLEDLNREGQKLAGNTPALNADAVEQAKRKLEQVAREMKVQNEIEQVRRGAQERMSTTGQRSAGRANAFGQSNNMEAGNPTPAPENGNTDMAGGAMFRQGKANREEDADGAQEGTRTGEAAGEADAMPVMGRATQRLDAQLKREAIERKDEDEAGDEKVEHWIYTGSQQQASALRYEDVRARGQFDREAAGQHDRIPVRQKQMVKNYFLNLHESESK